MELSKIKRTLKEGSTFLNNLVEKLDDADEIIIPTLVTSHELFYPEAERINTIKLKARGKYENNYPRGAIVHYTAGRYENGKQSALDSLAWARDQGYNFIIIAYDGTVLQTSPLNEWGYHAGESYWEGLGSSVSNKLVGIEICNAGFLKKKNGKYYSWYNTEIPEDQVRVIPTIKENQVKGYFHKYSTEQEESLIKLLVWLKENNPTVFNLDYILGHDEVAGPEGIGYSRKQDPGGALSMTMSELRKVIKDKIFLT